MPLTAVKMRGGRGGVGVGGAIQKLLSACQWRPYPLRGRGSNRPPQTTAPPNPSLILVSYFVFLYINAFYWTHTVVPKTQIITAGKLRIVETEKNLQMYSKCSISSFEAHPRSPAHPSSSCVDASCCGQFSLVLVRDVVLFFVVVCDTF